MIYLDYAANTPVSDEVLNEYVLATKKYIANPNSSHPIGKEAKEIIDECSKRVAKYFDTDYENVIYTSGASESNNLVLKGVSEARREYGNKIIISAVEHSSIVAPCNYLSEHGFDVEIIPLTKEGIVDLELLKEEIDDKTILVSICAVDSELGTVQPIDEIAKIVHEHENVILHTDATQAIGKVKLDYHNVDFITFAPHKFFGINGSGALINRHNIKITPLIHGGKSTTIYRSGTPVTALVIALDKALSLAIDNLDARYEYIKVLNRKLRDEFSLIDAIHINSPEGSIPNTLNISLINKDTKEVLKQLEENKVYLSTTTACSLEGTPSKSVLSITNDPELASNTLRISISHLTKEEEILEFISIFEKIINE